MRWELARRLRGKAQPRGVAEPGLCLRWPPPKAKTRARRTNEGQGRSRNRSRLAWPGLLLTGLSPLETHYFSSWFPGHVMYGIRAATGSMSLMKASPTWAFSCKAEQGESERRGCLSAWRASHKSEERGNSLRGRGLPFCSPLTGLIKEGGPVYPGWQNCTSRIPAFLAHLEDLAGASLLPL